MATSSTMKLVCLAIIAMALVNGPVAEALSCGDVVRNVSPCLKYLQGGGAGAVPKGCCDGIKALVSAAKTPADRQTVCKCLKAASQGVNTGPAAGLPGKCGVSIPYKISPSTDCSTVK